MSRAWNVDLIVSCDVFAMDCLELYLGLCYK